MALGEIKNGTGLDEYGIYQKVLAALADKCVVASGSNYIRFGDGTQICWGMAIVNGQITENNVRVAFPLAFSDTPSIMAGSNWNIGNTTVCIGWENSTSFSIGLGQPGAGISRWLAVGRWK